MERVRYSSIDEFIEWYLRREQRKHNEPAVPPRFKERREVMRHHHSGKLRDWFWNAAWSIVLLDKVEDVGRLVFYDDNAWTRREGLINDADGRDCRLLRKVAENAIKNKYLERNPNSQHRRYYDAMRDCHFRLEHASSLAVCTLNGDERAQNPGGTFYLHDGTGRALPYLILVMEGRIAFEAIMAFLAEEV